MIELKSLKANPKNPRSISKKNLEKLCNSIKNFEKMMELRPMIIDEDNIILGGNMRWTALNKLGYKLIPDKWIKKAKNLTKEEKNKFIIKDNIEYGSWKEDLLQNDFDDFDLKDWDLDIDFEMNWGDNEDLSDKNKEIDLSDLGDEGIIKLKFDSETYLKLLDRLNFLKKESDTNESLFLKMLKYYESRT